jgi:hypothetical protein
VSRRVGVIALVVAGTMTATGLREAHGQSWAVDLSAGRINYPLATDVGTAHVMGTLRYDPTPWAWLYGAGALPMRAGDPFWTSAGAGGRWMPARWRHRETSVGVDYAAEGFLFRDRLVPQSGSGASLDALPFVRLTAGRGQVDLRAGWRGYALSQSDTRDRRGVIETGARLAYGTATQFEAETRLVHADGTTYPFVGAALASGIGSLPVQVRLQAGRWLSDFASPTAWSAGLTVPLGRRAALWAAVRQDAPDPLYWNAPRRSWSVGVTRRLGRGLRSALPQSATAGTVTIRVEVREAAGDTLSIAGDFSNWRPMPMRREGDAWVVRLPLAPGVYHYAFRSHSGEWFVPASVAGRRDDGFGGHIAILVVS